MFNQILWPWKHRFRHFICIFSTISLEAMTILVLQHFSWRPSWIRAWMIDWTIINTNGIIEFLDPKNIGFDVLFAFIAVLVREIWHILIFGASKGGHLGFGHIWGGTIEQILVNFLSWLIDLFSYPFQLRNKIKQFFPTSAAYLLDYYARPGF